MNRKKIFFLCFALLSLTITEVFVLVFFYNKNSDIASSDQNINQKEFRNYWKNKIEKIGSRKSFLMLQDEYKNSKSNIQHMTAHLLGELIYQTRGTSGIADCDPAFSFGCYHGFLISYMKNQGTSKISELDDKCYEELGFKGIGCQHGIGHGLTEYFGHKEQNLNKSLTECSKLRWQSRLHGCYSGVLMEYFFPITIDENKASISVTSNIDKKKPFSFCEKLMPSYKHYCYFSISQWLIEVYHQDYAKIGIICNSVKNEEFKNLCFLGMGHYLVPKTNLKINEITTACDLIPNDGKTMCLSGAYWMLNASSAYNQAHKLCESLATPQKTICLEDHGLAWIKN